MVGHPVPYFIQTRHEVPGWFIMATDDGTTEAEHLIEPQPRGPEFVRRATDAGYDIPKSLLNEQVRPQNQERWIVRLVQVPRDRIYGVHVAAILPQHRIA